MTDVGLVTLRRPTPDDLPAIRALWGDEATMAPLGGPVYLTDAQAQGWFAKMVEPGTPSSHYLVIVDRDGHVVGEVSFRDWSETHGTACLNIKVAATSRGQGYGRAALTAFLDAFFGERGGREMTDDLALGNHAGRGLLESVGFEHDPAIEGVQFMRLTAAGYAAARGNRPPAPGT